jgi:hypothetical protein
MYNYCNFFSLVVIQLEPAGIGQNYGITLNAKVFEAFSWVLITGYCREKREFDIQEEKIPRWMQHAHWAHTCGLFMMV